MDLYYSPSTLFDDTSLWRKIINLPRRYLLSEKKVLVTGLAGKIGGIIRSNLSNKYSLSGLDLKKVEGFQTTIGNLSCLDEILPAFEGIDTVVHLAADPNHQGGWETNLDNNIVGTAATEYYTVETHVKGTRSSIGEHLTRQATSTLQLCRSSLMNTQTVKSA